MRKKFIHLIIPLIAFWGDSKAAYQPVALTPSSYNQDLVANGVALPSASTTTGFDVSTTAGYVFVAQDYQRSAACTAVPAGQGLPINGVLNGAGLYQMASYAGNNALQLTSASATGALTFATPVATTDFYLLASTGNGTGTMDITVTFSDASTEQFTGISISDWYGGSGVVFHGARVTRNVTNCALNSTALGPNLYEFNFPLSPGNYSKTIASIGLTRTNATTAEIINIMGVSVSGPCVGPVAGTASSVSTVCSGIPFLLSSGMYTGDAISWEESPQGASGWTPIAGASTANYALTGGQIADMDYRAIISCNSTTISSNVITVGISPFYDCYCSPLTGTALHTTGTNIITNVTIQGTSLNSSNGVGANGTGYTKTNPSLSGNTANLMLGTQYSIDVTQNGGTAPASGWIDYDQSGTFDAGEFISFSSVNPTHGTAVIPVTALTGQTGMRIRYKSPAFTAANACLSGGNETEDYTVNIVSAVNCAGIPDTGTATTTASSICAGKEFTLNAAGVTVGPGISYQWEESAQGAATWAPVAGATNTSWVVSSGIASATDYRLVTSCSFGGSNNSNIATVNVTPPTQCYCIPLYNAGCSLAGIFDARIDSVKISGANSTSINNGSTCSAAGYGNYPGISVDLEAGAAYSTSIRVVNTYIGTSAGIAVWIDLDDDGVFSTTEMLDSDTIAVSAVAASLNLSIPVTTVIGIHRMRIRYVSDISMGALDPCNDLTLGEAEDYMVNVVPANLCVGAPAAGTVSSTLTALCTPTASFTLSVTGAASGGGISYQWEELPQGAGAWNAISGATNMSYTVIGGLIIPTDYRLVVSCSAGGSNNSDTVTVAPGTAAQCVCTPLYTLGCTYLGVFDCRIEGVSIAGANSTSITNSPSGCSPGGYGVYIGQSVDMEDGATYTAGLTMVNTYPGGIPEAAVWIDLDDDGVFTLSERLGYAVLTPNATTVNLSLSIPVGSTLGQHRMRIRILAENASATMDPCADLLLGEAEDYTVNIVPGTGCSATPAGGTASASLTYLCSATTFTLNATGAASGGSITYQWEELPQGATAWSPISGATNLSYTVTGGLTVATDYRLVVTCLTGGTGISDTATVELGTPAQCVCVPVYALGCSYFGFTVNINGVNIQGSNSTSINNTGTGCTAGYSTYLGMSADMQAGSSYLAALTMVNNYPGATPAVAVWIDLDDDGVFAGAEMLDHDTLAMNATSANLNISIPAAAAVGPHRMRIRLLADIGSAVMDPCADLQLGETEDYMINVVPLVNCSGAPAGGTISATSSPACSGMSFTLNSSGAASGAGISYQWEAMAQGASVWTPISGATNINHVVTSGITVPTDYRLVVTCSFGSSNNSNALSVGLAAPAQCVCVPMYSVGCFYVIFDARIDGVTVNGVNSTAISNTSTGCSVSGYGTYLGQSVDLEAGVASYTVNLNIFNNYTGTAEAAVWVDLDDNGVFSVAEKLGTMIVTSSTPNISIPIPLTANLGPHRMRIRFTADNSFAPMDPCADLQLGEAEDYMVNIVAPLAISLADIKAENRGAKNVVTWYTQSEDKGDFFILERSFNGIQFEALATIDARGYATSYHYEDVSGRSGIHYYRVRMVDIAGRYNYSKIVSAYMDKTGFAVSVHPNPADKMITATIYSDKEESVRCEVIDLLGKTVIKSTSYHLTAGSNPVDLNVSGLSAGCYFIRIKGSVDNEVVRFIKK